MYGVNNNNAWCYILYFFRFRKPEGILKSETYDLFLMPFYMEFYMQSKTSEILQGILYAK